MYTITTGTFDSDEEIEDEGRTSNAGLTLTGSYDSRDNIFTPNSGTTAILGLTYNTPAMGGDFTYGRVDFVVNQYWDIGSRLILGLRAEYHQTGHEAPFYALPWVRLRGIPVFRYLGYNVVTTEIEPRWKISQRWSLLGFAGLGRAAINFDRLKDAEDAYNYGLGFRYLIARKLGLMMGLDLARGPEETVGYITVGRAW